jgi:hypothetical protein
MHRYVLLFAREPQREAREKGFVSADAAELFVAFASGWLESARAVGAALVIASPPEDRPAWRRRLSGRPEVLWLDQQGGSFGERLEACARSALRLPGHALIVGGDVAPDPRSLRDAFEALESGADAVLAPAEDGGISLVGLRPADLDLLGAVAWRRRDVFSTLHRRLEGRGRRVALVRGLPDVDGRRGARLLLRDRGLAVGLKGLVRRALAVRPFGRERLLAGRIDLSLHDLAAPRAPPRAA